VRALTEGYALYGFFVALVIYAGGEEAVCRLYEHPEFLETGSLIALHCIALHDHINTHTNTCPHAQRLYEREPSVIDLI
jgi:hypothetical protein